MSPDAEGLLAALHSRRALLLPGEVAEICGVHRSTVYRWIDEGRLPVVRLGRTLRIPRDLLARALERATDPAVSSLPMLSHPSW